MFLPYTGAKATELTAKVKQYTDLVEQLQKQQTPELKEQTRQCHEELMALRKSVMIEMFGSVEQEDNAG